MKPCSSDFSHLAKLDFMTPKYYNSPELVPTSSEISDDELDDLPPVLELQVPLPRSDTETELSEESCSDETCEFEQAQKETSEEGYYDAQLEQAKTDPLPPGTFEVERILKRRVRKGQEQYLIKWKGFSDAHNEWVDQDDVENAPELVQQFHQEFPKAPSRARPRPRRTRH